MTPRTRAVERDVYESVEVRRDFDIRVFEDYDMRPSQRANENAQFQNHVLSTART